MIFSLSPSAHQSACTWAQAERQRKIDALHVSYSDSLSSDEKKIHALSLTQLVAQCRSGVIAPAQIMSAYAKRTLLAHKATNCVTDIMFEEALNIPAVANWGPGVDPDPATNDLNRDRPLMGVPVSIKDTIDIVGHDSTIGLSRNVNRPARSSAAIVRLLQDAGALVLTKTTAPAGLLGLETCSDVFGLTTNPYNSALTPGGSTGGGAALLAYGGSKIEIGTDLGGSVRIPAHFCGIWSLKGSAGRFPNWGGASPVVGLEGMPLVSSPMAGNLDDLGEFWKRVVLSKPWQYDHTCIPLPWQHVDLQEDGRKLKWGIIWDDGMILPSPACRRALTLVIDALKEQGHEVVEFSPPSIFTGLKICYQLIFSDGGQQIRGAMRPSEYINAAAGALLDLLALPRFLKKALAYFGRSSDPQQSELVEAMHPKTILEERKLVAERDEYRAAWHQKWAEQGLDFVLSVPHALPAFEHGGSEKATLGSVGYTSIYSLLDYTAGCIPVTFVDKDVDALPGGFFSSSEYRSMSTAGKGAFSIYSAELMDGLPVGVQIVGQRLEEEKVLEGMKLVEGALKKKGVVFKGRFMA